MDTHYVTEVLKSAREKIPRRSSGLIERMNELGSDFNSSYLLVVMPKFFNRDSIGAFMNSQPEIFRALLVSLDLDRDQVDGLRQFPELENFLESYTPYSKIDRE